MRKIIIIGLAVWCGITYGQTTYDSTSRVDTFNSSTSTVNSNNVNNNQNINVTTVTSTNENINRSTSTNESTNVNINSGHTTSANTNTNVNTNTTTQDLNSVNRNDSYSRSDVKQTLIQPPPTAVAPTMMSGGNPDLCTVGVSGAVQTQILGVSAGKTQRDFNCERLKLSKTMYDMGMKVAAVSVLCQDRRVFDAMLSAGTPCPFDGKIGDAARQLWEANPDRIPAVEKEKQNASLFSISTFFSNLITRIFQ